MFDELSVLVPSPDSDAVRLLLTHIPGGRDPVKVRVESVPEAQERNCFENVQVRIDAEGGSMQCGWAVWQQPLFIEAEYHSVFDPGNGAPWIDCTPHILPDGMPLREILFIPDGSTYDFKSDQLKGNIRVPLVDDQRVREAIHCYDEITRLHNTVPGVNVIMPPEIVAQTVRLMARAETLLMQVERGEPVTSGRPVPSRKVGRNEQCPCGSKKKYKKCCGA